MGFLTRALIPSNVRRMAHPIRAVKRTVIPRPIRQAQGLARSVTNPVSALGFAVENAAVRAVRGGGRRLPSGYSVASSGQAESARVQKVREVQALARHLAYLASVHKQEFAGFVDPRSWNASTRQAFEKETWRDMKRAVPFWRRSERARLRASLPAELTSRFNELVSAAEALMHNVPDAVLTSLDIAFADNQTPAIPFRCSGACVSLALIVRDVETLLGNRKPGVTEAGNPSLSVWGKRDRNDYYVEVILSDVIGTVSEGFANAPGIDEMHVVVIRRAEGGAASEEDVDAVLYIELPRYAVDGVDWTVATPSDVVGDAQGLLDNENKAHALEPLDPADHPEIRAALDVIAKASVA